MNIIEKAERLGGDNNVVVCVYCGQAMFKEDYLNHQQKNCEQLPMDEKKNEAEGNQTT